MAFANHPFAGSPFAGGDTVFPAAPTRAALLTSGDYVICAEQRFRTVGTDAEHILIFCAGAPGHTGNPGFTTLSTDDPPNYEVAPVLDDQIQVLRDLAITDTSNLTGDQSGELGIMIPNGGVYLYTVGAGVSFEPLTAIQAQRQCGGQLFQLKIGRPEYGYASFITVFQTYAEALELVDIRSMRLRLSDYGLNFALGLLNVWAGTGGEEGTADLTGEVRAKHYGAPRNLTPRLALPATLTYHVTDRTPTTQIAAVYDGGVALTEDTSGYPFASWAAFQAHSLTGPDNSWTRYRGWFRTRQLSLGVVTVDMGDSITVPAIIRTMLEEAGAPADSIYIVTEDYAFGSDNSRSEKWQAFAEMLSLAPAAEYVSAQENVIDAVDRIAKAHGFSRYHDRDGRLCFDIMDYRLNASAVPGVDYTVLEATDSVDVTPQPLPASLWPPRFREYVLYDRNWTIMQQNQIFPDATDSFRQASVVEGFSLYSPDVTPDTSPIKQALPAAIDPPRNITCLIDQADASLLADWFQTRSSLTQTSGTPFLSQRRMYQVNLPLATGYELPFFRPVKLHIDDYWPDADLDLIAQLTPPSEDWANGRMTFLAYAYGAIYPAALSQTLFLDEFRIGYCLATSGDIVFVGAFLDGGIINLITAVDVSVPGNAVQVGLYAEGDSNAPSMVIVGTNLFHPSYYWGGLDAVDISNPAAMTRRGIVRSAAMSAPFGSAVSADEQTVFVSGTDTGSVSSIDITDPDNLTVRDSITDAALTGIRGIARIGDLLAAACLPGSLVLIDVSNPASLSLHATLTDSALLRVMHVAVIGDRIVLATGNTAETDADGQVSLIDMSDTSNPSIIKTMYLNYVIGGIDITGNYLYVTNKENGVEIFDISSDDFISVSIIALPKLEEPGPQLAAFGVAASPERACVVTARGLNILI